MQCGDLLNQTYKLLLRAPERRTRSRSPAWGRRVTQGRLWERQNGVNSDCIPLERFPCIERSTPSVLFCSEERLNQKHCGKPEGKLGRKGSLA